MDKALGVDPTHRVSATSNWPAPFAGIFLEVCAALRAIAAVGKGLDAYVAVDASGTFSETKRQVGLLRMLQAGVILSDCTTLMWKSSRTMRGRRRALPSTCPGLSSSGRSRKPWQIDDNARSATAAAG